MKKKIIAIHGLIGHGKDTLGIALSKAIRSTKGYNVYNRRFAFTVKLNVSNLTGIPLEVVDDTSYQEEIFDFTREQKNTFLPEWNLYLREVLQKYATEAVRNTIHKDAWIIALQHQLSNHDKNDVFIITDLRFPNEVAWLKEQGATLIKIIRPAEGSSPVVTHESEMGLDNALFDFIVTNDKDIRHLEDIALKIVNETSLLRADE